MSLYPIALFLHVSGAIGYFVGMGVWLFGLATMRRAQRVEQVRSIVQLVGLSGPLFGISVLLGVVFLMTTKPSLVGSIIVMAVALVLGLAWGLFVSRTTSPKDMAESTG